ncbi:MAG: hypothetical protein KatS3mg083_468 [Candidatus Dojkabacteria bacterium]|nr:MAG: hypothetical protein KatS3mg083_468 [Candidatus Dojkabacteria bacterium]
MSMFGKDPEAIYATKVGRIVTPAGPGYAWGQIDLEGDIGTCYLYLSVPRIDMFRGLVGLWFGLENDAVTLGSTLAAFITNRDLSQNGMRVIETENRLITPNNAQYVEMHLGNANGPVVFVPTMLYIMNLHGYFLGLEHGSPIAPAYIGTPSSGRSPFLAACGFSYLRRDPGNK